MRRHLTGVSRSLCLLALLALGASTASAAATQTWTMQFDDFPATPFGCDFEAKDLGERLTAAGVDVRAATCVKDSKRTAIFELSVTVDTPRNFEQESTGRNGVNFYGEGWYQTLAECESELPSKTSAFQRATGLEPFISYCSKRGASYSTYPYWPRIAAVGKGDLHLIASSLEFYNLATVDTAAVEKEIVAGFKNGPRRLAYSRVEEEELVLGYYSPSEERVSVSSLMNFANIRDCEENVKDIKGIYSQQNNPPLALACGVAPYSGPQATLVGVVEGVTSVKLVVCYDYYSSSEECQRNLPVAVADAEAAGEKVLGAVCGFYYGYHLPYLFQPR